MSWNRQKTENHNTICKAITPFLKLNTICKAITPFVKLNTICKAITKSRPSSLSTSITLFLKSSFVGHRHLPLLRRLVQCHHPISCGPNQLTGRCIRLHPAWGVRSEEPTNKTVVFTRAQDWQRNNSAELVEAGIITYSRSAWAAKLKSVGKKRTPRRPRRSSCSSRH